MGFKKKVSNVYLNSCASVQAKVKSDVVLHSFLVMCGQLPLMHSKRACIGSKWWCYCIYPLFSLQCVQLTAHWISCTQGQTRRLLRRLVAWRSRARSAWFVDYNFFSFLLHVFIYFLGWHTCSWYSWHVCQKRHFVLSLSPKSSCPDVWFRLSAGEAWNLFAIEGLERGLSFDVVAYLP